MYDTYAMGPAPADQFAGGRDDRSEQLHVAARVRQSRPAQQSRCMSITMSAVVAGAKR
jgi:hypothetical protein